MPEKQATPSSRPPSPKDLADAPEVRLRIDGGNSEERYDLYFEASRAGVIRFGMSCRLTGRQVPEKVGRVESGEVKNLVRTLNPAKLKQVEARQARSGHKSIPPCSLIGKLEVWDGRTFVTLIFMADDGQAKQAGHQVPTDVQKALKTIYEIVAKVMGLEAAAIRPGSERKEK